MLNSMGERIAEYKKHKGYARWDDFADYLGISQSTMSDIKNSRHGISQKVIDKIIRSSDLNIGWLLTGEGSMLKEVAPAAEPAQDRELTPEEKLAEYGITKKEKPKNFNLTDQDKIQRITRSLSDEIVRLNELKEKGILTEAEFVQAKARLLF